MKKYPLPFLPCKCGNTIYKMRYNVKSNTTVLRCDNCGRVLDENVSAITKQRLKTHSCDRLHFSRCYEVFVNDEISFSELFFRYEDVIQFVHDNCGKTKKFLVHVYDGRNTPLRKEFFLFSDKPDACHTSFDLSKQKKERTKEWYIKTISLVNKGAFCMCLAFVALLVLNLLHSDSLFLRGLLKFFIAFSVPILGLFFATLHSLDAFEKERK